MAKPDVLRAVADLADAYGREVKDETAAQYAVHLEDIEPALLKTTISALIRESKFFPSIAEIRRRAALHAGLLPPLVGEALEIIRRADVSEPVLRRDGSHAYTEQYWRWPDDLDPGVGDLLHSVVAKCGEPTDGGKARFGWEKAAAQVYEQEAAMYVDRVTADLSQARLEAPRTVSLPEPPPESQEPTPMPPEVREALAKIGINVEPA